MIRLDLTSSQVEVFIRLAPALNTFIIYTDYNELFASINNLDIFHFGRDSDDYWVYYKYKEK